ncbi:hypothetical protein M409DRAFT_28156 [Zasmidium cellare ATCC 36951]|uniref:VOC domain-containing protein n=1 Tax=Zasmidium cellare ATCC 36951 TaxID=1080233 RepID=A0A6A6C346_ZASCE|nr:uncharacterized protein M409DRAFT_28156 [Zasmidium cellare ATCC 36951]KAF2161425.1 hypothetical protein M409DRAFT_28156 [Zasmidium cellare ATCC 36951]
MSQTTDHDPAAPCSVDVGIDIPSVALMNQTLDFYINGIGFEDLGHIDIDLAHLNIGPVKVQALRFGNSSFKLKHDMRVDRPDAPRAEVPNLTHYATIRVKDIQRTTARLQALEPKPLMLIPPGEASTKQGAKVKFAFFVDPVGTQIEIVEGRPWVGTKNDDVV